METKVLKTIRCLAVLVHILGLAAIFTSNGTLFLLPVMAWSCLLFLASDNQIRESNSVFFGGWGRSIQVLTASVLFGIIMESANFFLGHHHYAGFPSETWIRWPLFTVVLAAVLPLILETERKLENLGLAEVLTWRRIPVTKGLASGLFILGILLLIPVVIIPSAFYPLLLVGFLLILDSVVHLAGREGKSLIGQFEEAYYGQAFRLISAGLLFGFFWEFWNFRAGAKWFYTPPVFDQAFLFEMPVLEFWGYAFVSLAGYAFVEICQVFKEKIENGIGLSASRFVLIVFLVVALASVLAGMDAMTTVSFRQVF